MFSFELVYKLIIYHPYQSIYFNNLVKKEIKYEVDYQSLSRFDAIKFILDNTKKDKIIVSTGLDTFRKRASLIPLEDRKKIIFSGTTNKEESDFIYTNYFYEVDIRYNKKYEILIIFLYLKLYILMTLKYIQYTKKS